ncbi:glycosyltransferase family 55 protein [Cucurbitaria berberidis CBS 394.84]|uniref:Glycosyltransferase family 55 protein n=1 Tax=Cucurbitaria berberidis CBS 394.84 TaxID=1168544 RepID=A0A9P4GD54_9PLEO|nr:glycosyltransferase family 55 protein [Cucurbitaria berberidis CBS 394.84]KAF1843207.1 glycosyltransferase family 55 protein [Cucurbitaria berberidis CBS 394.84]
MRLNINSGSTRVGDVEIHEVFRVTELDAGHRVEANTLGGIAFDSTVSHGNIPFSQESLHAIEAQLAIIIPCMDEDQSILDGVLHGIPHECLIIIVSNSNSSNFKAECTLLTDFCHNAKRPGIIVHQGDEGLAYAFHSAGLPELVVETSLPQGKQKNALYIRNGKGEAMMIGAAIAKLAAKQFVGFIDADNYVAGSVHEYCKVYAAGLHYALHCTEHNQTTSSKDITQLAAESNSMVRIKWNSKPKVKDGQLVFEKSGRCSRVVNGWMNRFLNAIVDDTTQNAVIQTGNAGEHAMSLNLAMELRFATGYAVEPFQLVNAWEQFGGQTSTYKQKDHTMVSKAPLLRKVQILQIETRNPHFHDVSKGNDHIEGMQVQGLSTIYHSSLTPPKLKDELRVYMKENFPTVVGANGEPERARVYPPLGTMDFGIFRTAMKSYPKTLKVIDDTTVWRRAT